MTAHDRSLSAAAKPLRVRDAWIAAAVFVVAVLCYVNTIHGEFVFDDITLIVNNDIVKDPHRVWEVLFTNLWGLVGRTSNYYRPLPPLLFMGLHALFGLRPEAFHAVNIAFHGMASALVFLLSHALLARTRVSASSARWASATAAILFAVHPVHTEAVAWISGLMDVSCTALSLLAVYLHVTGEGKRARRDVLSPLALFLALMCKEPAIVVPFLIISVDLIFERRRVTSVPGAARRWTPAFVAVVAYLCLRRTALGALLPSASDAHGWSMSAVLTLPHLALRYVGMLFSPTDLNVIHVIRPATAMASAAFWWPAFGVLALAGAAALAAWKGGPVVRFGLLVWLLPLAPALYVPALNQDIALALADRYAYFPSAGAAVLVAAALCATSEWNRRAGFAALATALVVAAVLTVPTRARNEVWHDSLTLWTDCARKSPQSAAAHENLGLALIRRGRECEGRGEMRAALALDPGLAARSLESGVLAAHKGLALQAVLRFQTALLFDPELVDGHYNLALAFEELGWDDGAVEQYRETLARRADRADAHNNLGILLARHEQVDEAIAHFEAAVAARPDDDDFRRNLERAYALKARR